MRLLLPLRDSRSGEPLGNSRRRGLLGNGRRRGLLGNGRRRGLLGRRRGIPSSVSTVPRGNIRHGRQRVHAELHPDDTSGSAGDRQRDVLYDIPGRDDLDLGECHYNGRKRPGAASASTGRTTSSSTRTSRSSAPISRRAAHTSARAALRSWPGTLRDQPLWTAGERGATLSYRSSRFCAARRLRAVASEMTFATASRIFARCAVE